MSGETASDVTALPGPPPDGAVDIQPRRRSRFSVLTRRDKLTMALMVGIPTIRAIVSLSRRVRTEKRLLLRGWMSTAPSGGGPGRAVTSEAVSPDMSSGYPGAGDRRQPVPVVLDRL